MKPIHYLVAATFAAMMTMLIVLLGIDLRLSEASQKPLPTQTCYIAPGVYEQLSEALPCEIWQGVATAVLGPRTHR